jgi:hypothetical protein
MSVGVLRLLYSSLKEGAEHMFAEQMQRALARSCAKVRTDPSGIDALQEVLLLVRCRSVGSPLTRVCARGQDVLPESPPGETGGRGVDRRAVARPAEREPVGTRACAAGAAQALPAAGPGGPLRPAAPAARPGRRHVRLPGARGAWRRRTRADVPAVGRRCTRACRTTRSRQSCGRCMASRPRATSCPRCSSST